MRVNVVETKTFKTKLLGGSNRILGDMDLTYENGWLRIDYKGKAISFHAGHWPAIKEFMAQVHERT